ncbi:MAG: AI-2E family transporter [Pyrinomonadaceae bacterium]
MKPLPMPGFEFGRQAQANLLDVLIRAALVGGLAVLCYRVFSPFLTVAVWSVILAVTLYPLHQWLARRVGRRQWLASTILLVFGVLLVVIPTALLLNSFADTVRSFIGTVQQNAVSIPPPREGVERWPVVGRQLHETWSKAHADFPGFVRSIQPEAGELARTALGAVASVGGSLLLFMASFVAAAVVMAYGESGARNSRAICRRVAGGARGEALARLSAATIRAVALGVVGVAFIQAVLIGLALLLAGVPGAGVLALIALVLSIAQVPALVVTLPVVVYIWSSGDYGGAAAVVYTIILLLTGAADNALKPLMLGRGVDAPMPVILFGALGGMAGGGILGMFVGATLLALGHQILMSWADAETETSPAASIIEQTAQAEAALKT